MSDEVQRTVANFARWLDEVVAYGDWKAEAAFISTNFTVHNDAGTNRFGRDEWIASLSSRRPPDWRMTVRDLIAHQDRLGILFTSAASDAQTGHPIVSHSIAVLRCLDSQFAEIWIASRPPEYGPWPNLDQSRTEWLIADDPLRPEEAAIAAAMTCYLEIRQTHEAEGLRQLFVDPMIVHGPGATREGSLDEFIRRVAAEPEITPGSTMQAHDCFLAGNKAILRWSYTHPNPTTEQPSPIAGLTLYAFRDGKIVERWQGELPRGTGW